MVPDLDGSVHIVNGRDAATLQTARFGREAEAHEQHVALRGVAPLPGKFDGAIAVPYPLARRAAHPVRPADVLTNLLGTEDRHGMAARCRSNRVDRVEIHECPRR